MRLRDECPEVVLLSAGTRLREATLGSGDFKSAGFRCQAETTASDKARTTRRKETGGRGEERRGEGEGKKGDEGDDASGDWEDKKNRLRIGRARLWGDQCAVLRSASAPF